MWDLIVSVPDHCLSFYFMLKVPYIALSEGMVNYPRHAVATIMTLVHLRIQDVPKTCYIFRCQ